MMEVDFVDKIIAAVIVTYNRIDLLKKVLKAFEGQLELPDIIVIVNNASTDGTAEYLDSWKSSTRCDAKIIVINNKENLGGSGGFYVGSKEAISLGADWIWVSDDDAIPNKNVFLLARKHIDSLGKDEDVSAICGKIIVNGKIAETNRNFRKRGLFRYRLIDVPIDYYEKDSFEIGCFSYLGVFMNAKKIKEVGLINPDFFIWIDDVEHSWRLSKVGKIICFPDMVIDHKVNMEDYNGLYSWKTYYGFRNDIMSLKINSNNWYVFCKIVIIMLKALKSRNSTYIKISISSIRDALNNKMGIHDIYKPGWK